MGNAWTDGVSFSLRPDWDKRGWLHREAVAFQLEACIWHTMYGLHSLMPHHTSTLYMVPVGGQWALFWGLVNAANSGISARKGCRMSLGPATRVLTLLRSSPTSNSWSASPYGTKGRAGEQMPPPHHTKAHPSSKAGNFAVENACYLRIMSLCHAALN